MKQIDTTAIVLSRINFAEADRIITVITPKCGKLKLIARGVRKIKSKLAGGIELFSISEITFINSQKEIKLLTSSRLQTHFGNILLNYDRTMTGYDILKMLNKTIHDDCDDEFYHLLLTTLTLLNNKVIDLLLVKCWFMIQLLKLLGHLPNLSTDNEGNKLVANKNYNFDTQSMNLNFQKNGIYRANHIKTLRLMIEENPEKLHIINDIYTVLQDIEGLLISAIKQYELY